MALIKNHNDADEAEPRGEDDERSQQNKIAPLLRNAHQGDADAGLDKRQAARVEGLPDQKGLGALVYCCLGHFCVFGSHSRVAAVDYHG